MAAPLLTVASTLMCPHGGNVAIVSSNVRASAGGLPLALATDTYLISGCPFQIPVGVAMVPHPCVSVTWLKTGLRTSVSGIPTVGLDSVGLCVAADQIPQGPVVIAQTQPRVSGA
jgi:hypothetical protein